MEYLSESAGQSPVAADSASCFGNFLFSKNRVVVPLDVARWLQGGGNVGPEKGWGARGVHLHSCSVFRQAA